MIHNKKALRTKSMKCFLSFGRDEATRTPDPYVPNVVRYQLRYIPIFTNLCKGGCKVSEKSRNSETFI